MLTEELRIQARFFEHIFIVEQEPCIRGKRNAVGMALMNGCIPQLRIEFIFKARLLIDIRRKSIDCLASARVGTLLIS